MVFYGGVIVLAVAVVLLTWGSFSQLARLPIQSLWLLWVGLVIQIALEFIDLPKDRIDDVGFGLLMLSYAAVLGFCFINLRVRGMTVITIGIALNALVIGINQGMPTRNEIVTRNGVKVEQPIPLEVKHRPKTGDTLLPFLGDNILTPDRGEVISFGDLILAVGILDLCYWGSRRRRPAGDDDDAEEVETVEPIEPIEPITGDAAPVERADEPAWVHSRTEMLPIKIEGAPDVAPPAAAPDEPATAPPPAPPSPDGGENGDAGSQSGTDTTTDVDGFVLDLSRYEEAERTETMRKIRVAHAARLRAEQEYRAVMARTAPPAGTSDASAAAET
jgi:Family of unknown function (DUF5317)